MAPMREANQSPNTPRAARQPSGPGRVAHWLPVVLVLVLLAGGLASYRFEVGQKYLPWLAADPSTEPAAVAPPAGLDLPEWTPPAVPVQAATAAPIDPDRVAQALRRPLADEDLGPRVSVTVGGLDGGVDWSHGQAAFIPASTTKVLTAVAALEVLGPEARFTTRVVRGDGPREVVLVGGGDPYLASKPLTPAEALVTYPERADVVTLAARVAAELGGTGRVRVRYDDSLFSGPADNPRWRRDYVADDIVSPITALMVDGGREADGWGRHDDPSRSAAQAFVAGLREAGLTVVGRPRPGPAAAGAEELAAVESAPLDQIVERVLEVSDNEGSEVLGHQVGLAAGGAGSFRAGARAVMETLAGLGAELGASQVYDGSGLSRHNQVEGSLLLDVLRTAAGSPRLGSAVTGLPVAGFTGSLAWRFEDEPLRSRGEVRAKTGTLTGVHALAGIVTDRDGVPLVFVVAADRVDDAVKLDSQQAVDRVAASLATCRCSRTGG